MISSDKQMILKCNYCNKSFPFYKNGSSPESWEHLNQVHPEKVKNTSYQSKRNYGKVSSKDYFITKANIILSSLIVTSKESFNFVSNKT